MVLYRMFDAYYKVSIFSALPRYTQEDEIFQTKGGVVIQVKHVAAYAALFSCILQKGWETDHVGLALQAIVCQLKTDYPMSLEALGRAYEDLIRKMVRLN